MDPFIAPELQDKSSSAQADSQVSSQEQSDPFISQELQTPSDVTAATQVGAQPDSSKYNGYCQQFVDDVLQTPPQNRQPSASASWQNYAQQGQAKPGIKGIQPGDLIYFNDPNDPNGHVGLYSGNGKFISATQVDPNKPVQNQSIAGWQELTGQQVLGYVKNPENLPQIGGFHE